MKFRPHRGSLEEAMRDMREIDATREAIAKCSSEWDIAAEPDSIVVKHYGFDSRIGWDTYIVTCGGFVLGFTDGPTNTTPKEGGDA